MTSQYRIPSLIAFSASIVFSQNLDLTEVAYRGDVYAGKDSIPLYTERGVEKHDKGKLMTAITRFINPQGELMAERSLDFNRFPFQPDYSLRDYRLGYEEGVVQQAQGLRVYFREKSGERLQEKYLKVPDPCVVDAGFNAYLKAHWPQLRQGKRVGFHLVIPARLDYFRFAAYIDSARSHRESLALKRSVSAVVIEPESRVLRVLLPPLVAYYAEDYGLRMVYYTGIASLNDDKGKALKVRIRYHGNGP